MGSKEDIPLNAPDPRSKEVDIGMFVGNNYAGDNISCRSRRVFLIYVNTTLVQWFSKKHSRVHTSVFCIEFVTMKQVIDDLRGLRYELRVMCIPISGP